MYSMPSLTLNGFLLIVRHPRTLLCVLVIRQCDFLLPESPLLQQIRERSNVSSQGRRIPKEEPVWAEHSRFFYFHFLIHFLQIMAYYVSTLSVFLMSYYPDTSVTSTDFWRTSSFVVTPPSFILSHEVQIHFYWKILTWMEWAKHPHEGDFNSMQQICLKTNEDVWPMIKLNFRCLIGL